MAKRPGLLPGEYDGKRVSSMKEALKEYLSESGLGWMMKHQEVVELWQQAAGKEIGEKTRIVSYTNGCLSIEVFSPTLKAEMENYHASELLEAMQAAVPEMRLRKLRFRLAPKEEEKTGSNPGSGEETEIEE